jgi:xylose isomerase
MSTGFFGDIQKIKYEGPDSTNPLAFRHYKPDEIVSASGWKTICALPSPTGTPSSGRAVTPSAADVRAPVVRRHDEGCEAEGRRRLRILHAARRALLLLPRRRRAPGRQELCREHQEPQRDRRLLRRKAGRTGVKLLWGTANLFSNRRYMSGAATNPDPDVFAFSAATVKTCLDATQKLGGENYVLWGGREGYETLLNTDLKRELDQMGRFLNLVVEYKHKIGFKGRS